MRIVLKAFSLTPSELWKVEFDRALKSRLYGLIPWQVVNILFMVALIEWQIKESIYYVLAVVAMLFPGILIALTYATMHVNSTSRKIRVSLTTKVLDYRRKGEMEAKFGWAILKKHRRVPSGFVLFFDRRNYIYLPISSFRTKRDTMDFEKFLSKR